jgi:four helix bundle protein
MQGTNRYSFRNLDPWKSAQDFAVEVAHLVDKLPNTRSADVIGRQLLRSATSIAANIAEGHARYSFGAYRNHLSIAKGSAGESEGWVNLLVRLGHLPEERGAEMESKCAFLMSALTRRMVALEQRAKVPQVREEQATYETDSSLVPWFPGSLVHDDLAEGDGR